MYLAHYGTKNMKWGVRKYQNEDGTLTAAGKLRYSANNMGKGSIPSQVKSDQQKAKKRQDYKDSIKSSIDKHRPKGHNDTLGLKTIYDQEIDILTDRLLSGKPFDYDEWMMDVIRDHDKSGDNERFSADSQAIMDRQDARLSALNAIYENTPQYKKRIDEWNTKHNSANTMGSGSIPTSAITAKQKAENEAKVKANIPASAWNQRTSALSASTSKKPVLSREYKQEVAYNTGTQIPSVSKADVNKKPNNASSEYLAEREYNSKKNSWR